MIVVLERSTWHANHLSTAYAARRRPVERSYGKIRLSVVIDPESITASDVGTLGPNGARRGQTRVSGDNTIVRIKYGCSLYNQMDVVS